ncbi:peptide n-glycanase, putative [Ricinus communis]|uniref:Peptide n-glycanase, putative n=1 Tax=Ricinus communis TaxID=3988 RepID=B9REQ2_RICCO|nr:peptide n-glycanase, putative [Ricinus communis]|eukprot:XP_002512221.1 peptide-N(4)-(N-acetyl-beta-glucosaminyl)asparagine amidase isoform X1 [Ricinus communis]
MVARKFLVRYSNSTFDLDYDTDDGFEVFKFQLFSLTSIPPDHQKIFGNDDLVISNESDLLTSAKNELKLVSISEEDKNNADFLISDEELARKLQAEEEALMLQQLTVTEQNHQFDQKIRPYVTQVLMYEDPVRQEAARKTVPVEELEEKALVSLAKEGNFKPSKSEQDQAFLLQLLFWFKESFRWVNAPPCDGCGSNTTNQGMGVALPSEIQYGATRVELYHCNFCPRTTRFPRYNDPMKLVETRRGRCGEWANCFTLYCRAFGYESRLILDFTDHVWTECFSQLLGRWMHLDPCEGVYDKPLLYERGWNKKLNYVIAIAKDGVYDVTKRYTRRWLEVLSRRNMITERVLSATLTNITKECRRSFESQVLSLLEDRDKRELEEIERDLQSSDDISVSLPGRQSGDKQWRISRAEIGYKEDGSLSSSFPVRVCIDEHVTMIYNAVYPVLSQFDKNSVSKSRSLEILKVFRGILKELRNLPYKSRRTSINPFLLHLLPYFDELLNALSLKTEINTEENVIIGLAGDPIKTSLALPVVLDALDGTCLILNKCENLSKVSLSLPLMRLNRIHSGSVLASGEELPFGIATSAFDGLCTTKWEEPNGARGCWIVYRLPDSQMHELAAYDLMSANDATERDPMDWVVEGSADGGSSWCVLDKQTSQVFENRCQRKSFNIRSENFFCNAFRFRFLAVKDVQSTSRLQLGSIDLYASSSVYIEHNSPH